MLSRMETPSALDLRTAKIDDVKARDLSPAMVGRAQAPKPTWFVERTGDRLQGKEPYIFACEETEAWDILNNKSEWKRHDFMFVGHSDGKTYKRICDEAMSGAAKIQPEINATRIEIEKYRAAEEKLIINEAVDMDGDPEDTINEENKKKVLRLRTIIGKLDVKLETLEKQFKEYTGNVVKRATAEELKVAIKNWKKRRVWPGAVNVITPSASPRERKRIMKAMNQDDD